MHVANLELCRELYAVSGWRCRFCHHPDGSIVEVDFILDKHPDVYIPAYDLGYLLRKLPFGAQLTVGGNTAHRFYDFRCAGRKAVADTPEDAAATLAIILFKEGVLIREK